VARSFDQIAEVEQFHESRYRKLIENVANGEVFKRRKGQMALHQLRLCDGEHRSSQKTVPPV